MTKRPTTTTALSANFQASNALPPLLRMQHSALRRRTPPATMRHRAEAAKSSAAPRPPVSFNGSDSHRTVRAVFLFLRRKPTAPFVAFVDAAQQSPSAPPLPPRSRHSATIHSAAAPPGACGANGHDRKRRRVAHPSRSRREVPPEKRGHRTKTHPLFRDFPQLFRASPRAQSNAPRQHPRSVRPTATLRAKTPSALTFFAYRFASLPIPPYLCADTCPQNFAPSVVKWPWLGFFSSPCCRNWW